MDYLDYIIDIERVNELTVHQKIDEQIKEGAIGGVSFSFGISRRLLKEYLSIYQMVNGGSPNRGVSENKMEHILKTLHYNKIIISPADIRDKEIDKVLKDEKE
jgi:hypothetical protein